jgi:hypothetical protein
MSPKQATRNDSKIPRTVTHDKVPETPGLCFQKVWHHQDHGAALKRKRVLHGRSYFDGGDRNLHRTVRDLSAPVGSIGSGGIRLQAYLRGANPASTSDPRLGVHPKPILVRSHRSAREKSNKNPIQENRARPCPPMKHGSRQKMKTAAGMTARDDVAANGPTVPL